MENNAITNFVAISEAEYKEAIRQAQEDYDCYKKNEEIYQEFLKGNDICSYIEELTQNAYESNANAVDAILNYARTNTAYNNKDGEFECALYSPEQCRSIPKCIYCDCYVDCFDNLINEIVTYGYVGDSDLEFVYGISEEDFFQNFIEYCRFNNLFIRLEENNIPENIKNLPHDYKKTIMCSYNHPQTLLFDYREEWEESIDEGFDGIAIAYGKDEYIIL